MAVLRTSLVALVLVCATCLSQTPESERDQYEAREDRSHPLPQLFAEATDQSFETRKAAHRFGPPPPPKKTPAVVLRTEKQQHQQQNRENDIVPDLQVGCGDGFIVEPTLPDKKAKKHGVEGSKLLVRRRRRDNTEDGAKRKRRTYFPITHIIRTPAAVSYSVWRPPVYQLSRPYYIPVWGDGKFPIYFPPQPVLINPGFPVDNPPAMRGYLPPVTTPQTPTASSQTPVTLANRFFDDDRPVWDMEVAKTLAPVQRTTTRRMPTRRTRRPGQTTTHPPLVHSSSNNAGDNDINNANSLALGHDEVIQDIFTLPTPAAQFRTTTARTTTTMRSPGREREPLNCVFAIISCCSANSKQINQNCFEQRGCPGPFWDTNPCDRNFADAALGSASEYFNAKK